MHGRNPEKLERTKVRHQGEYQAVQFRPAVLDACTATGQQIGDFVASIHGLNLTVLLNKVGGSASVQPLERHTAEKLDFLINVNARFPAQLTGALLPKLAGRDGPTLFMNIGSVADSCVPYATVYGGSKTFIWR